MARVIRSARLYVHIITEKNGFMTDNENTDTAGIESAGTEAMTNIDCWTACSANNIVLSKEQVFALERYVGDLCVWNQQVNMISRKDEHNVWEKHILHSLCLLKYVQFKPKARVLDVGTGGGLPGIPLKIARPDLRVTLVDSIRKKAQMTKMFAEHTMMKDINVLHGRVEELVSSHGFAQHFDVIVSRAVAPVSELVAWTRTALAVGGVFAFLKGGDLTQEVGEAKTMFRGLNVNEQSISLFGVPSFHLDNKKVVTCWFD
jgi:16S rRNA (guanine527-N7)-methyltransferase